MLNKLFKRKAEPAPPSTAQEGQNPKAGEVRQFGSEEILYLAPLPVYTGQQPVSMQGFPVVNDVYLQVGGSNIGMVWQGKMLAWVIWLMIIMNIFSPLFLAALLWVITPEGTNNTFTKDLSMLSEIFLYLGIFTAPICIGTVIYTIISQTREQARQYPLRFNRQRREVCFVDSNTHEILIVPWEKVTAWISQGQMVTQYNATTFYTFGMALENEEKGTVQPILIDKPSQAHAIGTWEAIRLYMEQGVPTDETGEWLRLLLGRELTEYELRPYEGLHTWEVEKLMKIEDRFPDVDMTDEERAKHGFLPRDYWALRWWYVWRVLSFWKMPYMIAEWGHKAGTPTMPERVQQWSQPIPPEQWAKPSPALQKATQVVQHAMDKKKMNFIEACKLIERKA
ncbi:hypothetical protein CFII64_17346 [Pseudomonas sp. CFII64]|uniref:DUF6708 domain-containing protein n=1 Tax=Pseudomonas sp. CFII64 TaxID=911242 RepID=UPI000357FF75|nr:DUF6708 domain-containing protein [Pseudomonas sp. CFII64]EPJ81987.1 hypothetical protein CFII64_17346 [Pseudomonas sp. CFII64]